MIHNVDNGMAEHGVGDLGASLHQLQRHRVGSAVKRDHDHGAVDVTECRGLEFRRTGGNPDPPGTGPDVFAEMRKVYWPVGKKVVRPMCVRHTENHAPSGLNNAWRTSWRFSGGMAWSR